MARTFGRTDGPPVPLTTAETLRVRFLEEIAALAPEAWLTIGQRHEAEAAALAAIRGRVARAIDAHLRAKLATVKGFQEHTIAFNNWAHARLVAAMGRLPDTVDIAGGPYPLRAAATSAARAAESLLRLFEKDVGERRAPALAAPALRPFEGFVTLPPLAAAVATRAAPRTRASAPTPRAAQTPSEAPGPMEPPASYHLCFAADYFAFDEPPPAGVRLLPLNYYRRETHHETWSLTTVAAGPECAFGGVQDGTCGVCGGGLHHLVSLPRLPGAAFESVGPIAIATCLACLGWAEPVLCFEHDAAGKPRPVAAGGARRAPAQRAWPLRSTTVNLRATPARWRRQRWEEADGQNLNRVGGKPTWVQDPQVPKCPRCRRRMEFLLHLDSDLPTIDGQRWRWGSGGLLYVFHCVACRVDAQLWQCT